MILLPFVRGEGGYLRVFRWLPTTRIEERGLLHLLCGGEGGHLQRYSSGRQQTLDYGWCNANARALTRMTRAKRMTAR